MPEVGILHRKWMCRYSLGGREGEAEGLQQAGCRCLYYAAFGLMPSYQSSSALANIHAREELEKTPNLLGQCRLMFCLHRLLFEFSS